MSNQGTITTHQDLLLQIGGAFTNLGAIVAGNNLRLNAAGQIDNRQLVSAGRDLWVSAADANGTLYPILNRDGSFLAGNDARFDASCFINATRGGLASDTGWQHVAMLYPEGTGIGKGLPGGVSPPSHYYGQLTLELGYVYTRTFKGQAAVVSAGHDLLINGAGGGLNQASTIVAGHTVTLLGNWEWENKGSNLNFQHLELNVEI